MRTRRLAAATVALLLVVGGLGSAAPAPAQTPEAVFSVEPSTGLVDGQSVRYAGSGFPAGADIAILQCIPGATDLFGVLTRCAFPQTVTAPDATGSIGGFFTVSRTFLPVAGGPAVDCAAAAGVCAISVFDFSTVIDVPIAFADPLPPPPPTISVLPTTTLEDGSVVTVTGRDFPAGAAVTVAQCVADATTTVASCDDRPPVTTSADAAGAFVVELTIHRGITTPDGVVTDCASNAGSRCAISAFTSEGAPVATRPITLTVRTVRAAATTFLGEVLPLAVSPTGTVAVAGSLFCLPPTFRPVAVSGIVTQTVGTRVVTAEFTVAASCPAVLATWSAQVGGSRAQRFKVGPATVTTWAVEEADPLPDDAERRTVDVELVRPAAAT
jgi:Neocarzinostatin family